MVAAIAKSTKAMSHVSKSEDCGPLGDCVRNGSPAVSARLPHGQNQLQYARPKRRTSMGMMTGLSSEDVGEPAYHDRSQPK